MTRLFFLLALVLLAPLVACIALACAAVTYSLVRAADRLA